MVAAVYRLTAGLLVLQVVTGLGRPASLTLFQDDGSNLTVYAQPASFTPELPAAGSALPLSLLFAGDGCTASVQRVGVPPFALFVERGFCSFDEKMRTAVSLGAHVLIVADSLRGEYRFAGNETAETMGLTDPCVVDCKLGEGFVDPRRLSTQQVLDGLSGSCGAACGAQACAFSGRGSVRTRQVCCFKDVSLDMALPGMLANHSALPALFVSLSQATALRSAIEHSWGAKVVIELVPRHSPSADLSSLCILLLGTLTASIMSYLAGTSQFEQDNGSDLPSSGYASDQAWSGAVAAWHYEGS